MMKRSSKIPSIGSLSSTSSSSSSEKPPIKGKYQSVVLSQKPTTSGSSRLSYLSSYGTRATGRSSNTGSSNGQLNGENEVKSSQSEKQSKLPQARSGIPKSSSARSNVERAKDRNVTTNAQPQTTQANSKEKVHKQSSTGRRLSPPKSEALRVATGRPLTPNSEVLRQVQAASTLSLSESQLNMLSYNLSEIADRISPSHYSSTRVFQFDAVAAGANSERPRLSSLDRSTHSHIKPPYLRKDKGTKKLPFAKPKTFKGKAEAESFHYQRTENLPSKSADTSGEESSIETESESSHSGPAKQASKDSGYSSSGTWSSFSLDENLKLDLKEEDNRELREVFADLSVGEKSSAKAKEETQVLAANVSSQRRNSRGAVLNKQISDVQDRLDSLIRGSVDAYRVVDNDGSTPSNAGDQDSLALKPNTAGNDLKDSVEKKTEGHTSNQNTIVNGESPEFTKSPFQIVRVQKQSVDDLETGRRRGPQARVLKRRSTVTTFRPPRTMEARQFEEGVVSMDEAGYMTCMNDIKAVKTMLLKLKRELQEADVVSPLSRSYSTSRSSPLSPLAVDHSPSAGKVMRRSTYDAGMMREKLRRARTRSFHKALEDEVFKPASPTGSEPPTPTDDKEKKENQALKEELKEMKEKYIELTKERDSIAFDKEELEHDLESKNHTIKMLQTQLEKQDNLDEVAYLKRQVKSLTEQVHQQQQKITQLRYRTTSPANSGTTAHITSMSAQKGSVKQEIRVRLRDAFVRHLEESSKSHALLSKQISRTENTINQAQKGLRSLCSPTPSPKCTPSSSREDINHCGRAGSKVKKDRAALRNSDFKSHSWTTDTIEKIVKTWKDTGRLSQSSSIDTSDSDSGHSLEPGNDLRRMSDPSRFQFL